MALKRKKKIYAMAAQTGSAQQKAKEECLIQSLPAEILMKIMQFLPAADVYVRCSLVCKDWLTCSRDNTLWKRLCERDNRLEMSDPDNPPEDYLWFYFAAPNSTNLLWINRAVCGVKTWIAGFGNEAVHVPELHCERIPSGVCPTKDSLSQDIERRGRRKLLSSDGYSVVLRQTFDLEKIGCSPAKLDSRQLPSFEISFWLASVYEGMCGSEETFIQVSDKIQHTLAIWRISFPTSLPRKHNRLIPIIEVSEDVVTKYRGRVYSGWTFGSRVKVTVLLITNEGPSQSYNGVMSTRYQNLFKWSLLKYGFGIPQRGVRKIILTISCRNSNFCRLGKIKFALPSVRFIERAHGFGDIQENCKTTFTYQFMYF